MKETEAGRNSPPGITATTTPIAGLAIFKRFENQDARGSFSRIFSQDEHHSLGWTSTTRQVNFSRTARKGSIRGMHAQLGTTPEFKVVTCVRGVVWDVCVDLRRNSQSFLRWEAFELSENNALSLAIPPGVAHGFQTLRDDVELVYCHSASYEPDSEFGVSPFDPLIDVVWPLEVTVMSDRDRKHELLPASFKGVVT